MIMVGHRLSLQICFLCRSTQTPKENPNRKKQQLCLVRIGRCRLWVLKKKGRKQTKVRTSRKLVLCVMSLLVCCCWIILLAFSVPLTADTCVSLVLELTGEALCFQTALDNGCSDFIQKPSGWSWLDFGERDTCLFTASVCVCVCVMRCVFSGERKHHGWLQISCRLVSSLWIFCFKLLVCSLWLPEHPPPSPFSKTLNHISHISLNRWRQAALWVTFYLAGGITNMMWSKAFWRDQSQNEKEFKLSSSNTMCNYVVLKYREFVLQKQKDWKYKTFLQRTVRRWTRQSVDS